MKLLLVADPSMFAHSAVIDGICDQNQVRVQLYMIFPCGYCLLWLTLSCQKLELHDLWYDPELIICSSGHTAPFVQLLMQLWRHLVWGKFMHIDIMCVWQCNLEEASKFHIDFDVEPSAKTAAVTLDLAFHIDIVTRLLQQISFTWVFRPACRNLPYVNAWWKTLTRSWNWLSADRKQL